mmetsp:Transcript_125610/g.250631  ORF Transcript_125610/g.250631 Transcript_125610/m.250631 type:complete len:293 (-) Transcript_125610:54-932(-)
MAASILILFLSVTVDKVWCEITEDASHFQSSARTITAGDHAKCCVSTSIAGSCGHCYPNAHSPGWCSEAKDHCENQCGGTWCPQGLPYDFIDEGSSSGEAQPVDMNSITAAPLPAGARSDGENPQMQGGGSVSAGLAAALPADTAAGHGTAVEQHAQPHSISDQGSHVAHNGHGDDNKYDGKPADSEWNSGCYWPEIVVSCLMGVSIIGGFVMAWQDWHARKLGARNEHMGCFSDALGGRFQRTQWPLDWLHGAAACCTYDDDDHDENRTLINIENGTRPPVTATWPRTDKL